MKMHVLAACVTGSILTIGIVSWLDGPRMATPDSQLPRGRLTLSAAETLPKDTPVDMQATGSLQAGPPPSRRQAGGNPLDSLRATIRAGQQVTLSAEINARITRLALREGDRFNAGDVLVSFDCARTDAELGAARAFAAGHKNNLDNILYLERHQAAGRHSVRQTRLEFEKASQELKAIEARKSLCTIVAPFNGRVAEKLAYAHELANQNQPLLRLVDESLVELQVLVPSKHLRDIALGQVITVAIDEVGKSFEAKVSQIAGAIDPISQTARVMAQLISPGTEVLAGMSGTVVLSQSTAALGNAP